MPLWTLLPTILGFELQYCCVTLCVSVAEWRTPEICLWCTHTNCEGSLITRTVLSLSLITVSRWNLTHKYSYTRHRHGDHVNYVRCVTHSSHSKKKKRPENIRKSKTINQDTKVFMNTDQADSIYVKIADSLHHPTHSFQGQRCFRQLKKKKLKK